MVGRPPHSHLPETSKRRRKISDSSFVPSENDSDSTTAEPLTEIISDSEKSDENEVGIVIVYIFRICKYNTC